MFKNFYKGKRVFVTGHTGFKGSWLSHWLLSLGAEVHGYSLAPYTDRDHYNVSGLNSLMAETIADIRDYEKLGAAIKLFNPDVIFHLAAQPLVRESYKSPRETFDVNVMGTVNLLDHARGLTNLKGVVNITSDKCYENPETGDAFVETDPMGGHDPYSASKGCAELISQAYRRSFNKDHRFLHANVRAGNVIGGGDWCKDRIMTDAITSVEKEKPLVLRNPKATRPWQHVLEPLGGYLWLGAQSESPSKEKWNGGWNFGPSVSAHVTVKEVVEMVYKSFPTGQVEVESNGDQPHEAKLLHLSIDKATKELNWSPTLTVEESATWTAEWYKQFLSNPNKSMQGFTHTQIKNYFEKSKTSNQKWAQ